MAATALYLRISLDDEKRDESNSITSQRDLLRSYAAGDPTLSSGEILEFSDDGWSGTNFERPQVQALLDLAKRGGVKNILVKDLSRWGRSYTEVCEYLDQIFPFLGIRFVSVNDQYDSDDYKGRTAPMDVAFRSIMHGIYSKELSVKIKQSHTAKALKGEYVCGSEPFGYRRSVTDKNRLVVDEAAAVTIRRIFDMAAEGLSSERIAAALNADGVDTALENRRRNGRSTLGMKPINGRSYWGNKQVLDVLRDERYTGMMICFKSKKVTLGSKKQVKRDESEWVKVPNTHEAIISAERFAEVNSRIRRNKKTPRGVSQNRSPFAGKIFCGCCGRAMVQRECLRRYHFCKGPKRNMGLGCYEGKVFIDELKAVVLAAAKTEAQKVYDARQLRKQLARQGSSGRAAVLEDVKRLTARRGLLERRGVALYEDFADGKLDKDGYLAAKAACAAELAGIEARSAELALRLEGFAEQAEIPDNEPILRRVLDAEDATDDVIALLDRVTVYDAGRIDIRFAFSDTNVAGV